MKHFTRIGFIVLTILSFTLIIQFCAKKKPSPENDSQKPTVALSSEAGIILFSLKGHVGIIPKAKEDFDAPISIYVALELGTTLEGLIPTIILNSKKSTIFPAANEPQDFNQPVLYTVTSEDGKNSAQYQVHVILVDFSTTIHSFKIKGAQSVKIIEKDEEKGVIEVVISESMVFNDIKPTIVLKNSETASVTPASGQPIDLSNLYATYTVNSGLKKRIYHVRVFPEILNSLATFSTDYSEDFPDLSQPTVDIEHPNLYVHLNVDRKWFTHYEYTVYRDQTLLFESAINALTSNEINIDIATAVVAKQFDQQDLRVVFSLYNENTEYRMQTEQKVNYIYLASSNIPMIYISTENAAEPLADKERINTHYTFYDAAGKNGLYSILSKNKKESTGTVNARGNSSIHMPKKGLTLRLDKKLELLGMPRHDRWILVANYIDVTHLANALAYELYREMGNYAVHTHPAHVYLNGNYRGLYTFSEKIEQGGNRVPTPNAANEGFILKIGKFPPDVWFETILGRFFTFEYPSSTNANAGLSHVAAETLMSNYEKTLTSSPQGEWRQFIDESVELDHFIINDVFANIDGYHWRNNIFYFLHQDTRKLTPIIWDFDLAFGPPMMNHIDASIIYDKDILLFDPNNPYQVMPYYFKDSIFVRNFVQRYSELRQNKLSTNFIVDRLEAIVQVLMLHTYTYDAARWQYPAGSRFTPEEFKRRLLHRLNVLDQKIPQL